MARDYYETLGVDRGADDAQIKKAFRRLARELHPDVNAHDPDAEEKFKEAAGAYEVLSDPERRKLYDAYGEEGLRGRGYAPDMDAFGSVSDLFSAIFGQGGFEAAFGTGGGGRRGRGGGTQGGDVVTSATIDLADSARGIQVEVAYDAAALCGTCHGNGAEPGTPIVACATCGGSGQHQRVARTAFGQLVRTAICEVCGGDGRIPETPCHECDGAGLTRDHRRVAVDIPPGIADGQRIRLTRRGHAGQNGGPAGDLYVVVRVREDERFLRDGEDLITVIDVAAPLAALGTTVEVPTFDGPVAVEVPAGHPARRADRPARARAAAALARPHGRHPRRRQRRHAAPALTRAEGPARALRRDDHGRQHPLRRGHARQAQAGAGGLRAYPRRRHARMQPIRGAGSPPEGLPITPLWASPSCGALHPRLGRSGRTADSWTGPDPPRGARPARRRGDRAGRAARARAGWAGGDRRVRRRRRVRALRRGRRAARPAGARGCGGRHAGRGHDLRGARRLGGSLEGVAPAGRRRVALPPPARAAAVGGGAGRRVGNRPRDRPGPGVRHGRAPHDAAVPRAAARARPGRRARRLGVGQRRARDRRGAARLHAGARRRRRAGVARGLGRERPRQRRRGGGAAGQPAAAAGAVGADRHREPRPPACCSTSHGCSSACRSG